MKPEEINNGLPNEVRDQLMPNEKVYYFSFIAFKGGCGSSDEKEKYWLSLTDRRVMYKTRVFEGEGKSISYVEKDGDLPFNKISFIEVSEVSVSKGCSNKKVNELRISSSGGTIKIPIPTKEKGYQIRKVYTQLNQD